MREIERAIEKSQELYPWNGGRVTNSEVLRRAGLDRAILQKSRHRELRDEVNIWVHTVSKRMISGSKVVRKAVSERVDTAKSEANEIRQRWAEAELIYIDQEAQIRDLAARCDTLEQENARLRASIAGENVVPIVGREG